MYGRILVSLEGKDRDQAVLDHVQQLVAQAKAKVTVLRVIPIADDGGGGLGKRFQLEPGSSGWRRRSQAEAYLSQVERKLEQRGICVEVALVISTHSEGDAIVSYAAQHACDLIVMANDPRPWFKRWIGGSPASGVQRKAGVPTLFVNSSTRLAPVARTTPKVNTVMAIFGGADL